MNQNVTAPPQRAPARAGTAWVLRVCLTLAALAVALQPLLIGFYLDGNFDLLGVHSANGIGLVLLMWLPFLASVLHWLAGRGPWWPAIVTLLLALATPIQLGMGFARFLGVHVALGVTLVAGTCGVAVWSWGRGPRRASRASRAARVASPGTATPQVVGG
jgi:hypothetical protein